MARATAAIEPPRCEDAHRAGKTSARRHSSPVKGRRSPPARSLEDAFNNIKIKEAVDDCEHSDVLDLLNTADVLVDSKVAKDEEFEKFASQLPLLSEGDFLASKDVGVGFRVREDNEVLMDVGGNFKVMAGGGFVSRKDNIKTILMKYQSGFAWCYWTREKIGKGGKTLAECLRDYGSGVKRTTSGLVVKGVFLSEELCPSAGKFFTLAVLKDEMQIPVKQQEEKESVFRVFRSCVPLDIKDAVNLHQLINVRNKNPGKMFWEMQ